MDLSTLNYILLAMFLDLLSIPLEGGTTSLESSFEIDLSHSNYIDGEMPEEHANWGMLDREICGTSLVDRIIGGTNAQLGEYPWIVLVGHRYGPGNITYFCGGSIITENIVLTAAHCIPHFIIPNVVRAGELDTSKDKDCVGSVCSEVQDREIEVSLVHEEFDHKLIYNDIAIVKIKGTFKFDDFVRPVCLMPSPVIEENIDDKTVVVAGWGIVDIQIEMKATILQKVSMKVLPLEKCKMYYPTTKAGSGIVCSGGIIGHDSCRGDSGGPLMYKSSKEGSPKTYLLGIVSYGIHNCATGGVPSVYSRVSNYENWILDKLTL